MCAALALCGIQARTGFQGLLGLLAGPPFVGASGPAVFGSALCLRLEGGCMLVQSAAPVLEGLAY